nr:serine carboxypeptidase-like 13 isoform X2 [Ipomoea batatas]
MKPSTKHYSLFFNHFLILAIVAVVGVFPQHVISAGSKVDVLPGFEGPLPFHLETGYIGVGESEEIQLFYYFVKSETNPKDDPLILWISGEQGCSSLTGLIYEIGNEAAKTPINLEGYILGNPKTFPHEENFRVVFAYGMGFLTTEFYEVDYHRLSNYWANDPSVQNALHVRKDSSKKWTRCNWNTVSKTYEVTVQDTRLQHAILNAKGYRSLIYSGDHDMIVPFQSTQAWIRDLYYTIDHDWTPYFVNHEVAGYGIPPHLTLSIFYQAQNYTRNFTSKMTYATVKGAGHIATEQKPEMCVGLISRWIAGKDIAFFPFSVVTTAFKQFMQSRKDKLSPFSQLQAETRDFPFILG